MHSQGKSAGEANSVQVCWRLTSAAPSAVCQTLPLSHLAEVSQPRGEGRSPELWLLWGRSVTRPQGTLWKIHGCRDQLRWVTPGRSRLCPLGNVHRGICWCPTARDVSSVFPS